MTGQMNPFLANLYKTAENIGVGAQNGDDTEKLAQAAVLEQMFQNDGLDIRAQDDATVLKVAAAIFGPNNEIAKLASSQGAAPASEETDEEKTAKADYLGRVMAHSMVQELANIEKEAAEKQATFGPLPAKGHHIEKATRALKGAAGKVGKKVSESAPVQEYKLQRAMGGGRAGSAYESAKRHGGKAVAAAGAGVVAGEAHGRLSKESSAVDMLAQQKVAEILAANGIDQGGGSEEEKLAAAVDARAQELLAELGYTLE